MYFEVFWEAFESKEIENIADAEKEEAPKRGPGRPPKSEEKKKPPYQPTGKPRGRPPKNPKDQKNPDSSKLNGKEIITDK